MNAVRNMAICSICVTYMTLVVVFLSLPIMLRYSSVKPSQLSKLRIYTPVCITLEIAPEEITAPYWAWCELFNARLAVVCFVKFHNSSFNPQGATGCSNQIEEIRTH